MPRQKRGIFYVCLSLLEEEGATISAAPLRLLACRDALFLQQVLQFAGLEHLADDIAAADELALHVKLRDGRPVRIRLDAVLISSESRTLMPL